MKKSLLAALVSTAAILVAAPMAHADDYYLKVNGLNGGNQVLGKVNDAVKVNSFDWGAENKTTIGSTTGGAGAGKVSFHELTITKSVDATSPMLFQALASGKPYASMELVARKSGEAGAIYQRYYFGMAFVTAQKQSGDGDHIEETITFTYGATQMTNVPQTATGAMGKSVFQAWNMTTNTDSLQIAGLQTPPSPFLF
jgi:type VI secretion system secreted protein Hcp